MLIQLLVSIKSFEDAALVYLDLENKKTLVEKLALVSCEDILKALLALQKTQEASWLAIVLGDTYAINGKMDKTEELYSIGHKNDKAHKSRYETFIEAQKKTGEEEKEMPLEEREEIKIPATAFRISQLIEKGQLELAETIIKNGYEYARDGL